MFEDVAWHAIARNGINSAEYVLLANNGKWMGQILPDFDTVWHMQADSGRWVTIEKSSRGRRNEIINGAVLGSSYNRTPGLPATERFSGGNPVVLTREFCYGWSAACWEISKRYVSWDTFKSEILRALRTAGFFANTVSSTDLRFEFHNGDSNEQEKFGITVQPMSMSASIVHILDRDKDEYIVEALGASQVHIGNPFTDIHEYPYLWSLTSNSVREEILDKDNRIGFKEYFCEPLLSGNIRIPTLGTFRTLLADTGWAAKIPAYRIREYAGSPPYPWIMRDETSPPSPFND